MSNTITAYFKGRIGVAESVYQNDYGIVMAFDSIDLPAHFDCYFSRLNQEEALPGLGADNRVTIPNSILANPGNVTIHIPLHTGEDDSEVEYVIYFKVIGRARPIDDGTPAQMTAIERALALLSQPITNIEEIVNEALSFTGDTFDEMKAELQEDFDNYTETLEGDLATWKGGVESDIDDVEHDFTVLQNQFDTAVAAVSTDTELTDIRVGDDEVTYTTAGLAVRTQFSNLKSDLSVTAEDLYNNILLGLTYTDKWIINEDTGVGSANNNFYSYTSISIPDGAETLYGYSEGSPTHLIRSICFYDANGNYISGAYMPVSLAVPSNAVTFSATFHYPYSLKSWINFSPYHIKYEDEIKNSQAETIEIVSNGASPYALSWSNGFISASNGNIVSNAGYRYSGLIPVKEGDVFKFRSHGSDSVLILGLYQNATSAATLANSVVGANGFKDSIIAIPSGINYIRICCYADFLSSVYLVRLFESIRKLNDKMDTLQSIGLTKRKASVSFIFDDGNAKDSQIKTIFDSHEKKCGFAVYAPVNVRYVGYYDEGFEILAHATAKPSSETVQTWKTLINNSYNAIVNAVGECHGWVTPSSEMSEAFAPLVYDTFEYGYTLSKGNYENPTEACMRKTELSYRLWRSSLQILTVAQIKAILDYAVANNLMVCLYGHAADLDTTDNLTTNNLNEVLTYCDTIGIEVKTPYASVSDFFAYRHNEDYLG